MRFILVLLGLLVSPPVSAMDVQRVQSPSGLVAWFVHDPTIPVVAVSISLGGGAVADPVGKEGLAVIATDLLTEGAGPYDSQAFAAKLEDASIGLDLNAGSDFIRGGFRAPSQNAAEAFRLLGLALAEPRFAAADIDRVRQQHMSGLSREERDPRTLASRAWYAAAFPEHPYGRSSKGTEKSVAGLTREDIVDFAKARIARDNLKIGVVGDIDATTVARLLDETFGRLPAKATPAESKSTPPAAGGDVLVIERPVPQSVVMFGQPGIARSDPDFMAANLLNQIVGGGSLGSRLMTDIREKRGLTYGIYTYLSTPKSSGLWLGSVSAENAKVAEVIRLIRESWQHLKDDGVTAAELDDAKRYMTGAYARGFATSRGIAGQLVGWQEEGLGIDYFKRRNGMIETVTLADINRVANRLVEPDKLMFSIVGRPQGVTPTRPAPARG
ncbi:MAG: insulinase family protein [Alphaproteobacteria bacterium]|nr:insulinase family protein [Alphaproteobacteria bacterium]